MLLLLFESFVAFEVVVIILYFFAYFTAYEFLGATIVSLFLLQSVNDEDVIDLTFFVTFT